MLWWPSTKIAGWSGGAKVLCILHHWGVQLILAYSWARPAILVVGKGRGGMFLFLLFLHFHSCSSFFPVPLFHLLYSLLSLFSLSPGDDTKWPSRVDVSLNPNTIKSTKIVPSWYVKKHGLHGAGLIFRIICIENFKIHLVRNHLTDFNITCQECCFGDPLSRLFKQSWFVKKHGC